MSSDFNESNHGSYGNEDDLKAPEAGGPAAAAEGPAAPDVFRYEDYRAFLWERFSGMQALDPAFSQRRLARKAGIANPGFFNEVIKGRRRLSPAAARKMALGLDLSGEETEFFSALVEYAEIREPGRKAAAGKRLIAMRHQRLANTLAGGEVRADGAGQPTGAPAEPLVQESLAHPSAGD
jgi:hypothetical protein